VFYQDDRAPFCGSNRMRIRVFRRVENRVWSTREAWGLCMGVASMRSQISQLLGV
jgi:hypothetical protein